MGSLRKLSGFLKPYWKAAVLAPLLMMLEVTMDLMQPRLIQEIVDVGIARHELSVVMNTGLLMVGLALLGAFGGVGCAVFSVIAAQGFGADLRGKLFRKVQSLSFGNIDDLETGQLVTRLTNDVTQVQDVVMVMLRIMVRAPLMLIGSMVMALVTSPRLAVLLFALLPPLLAVLLWVVKRAHPLFSEMQRRLDALNTLVQENLAGVRVVKAFARGTHEKGRFGKVNDALTDQTIRAARLVAVTMPAVMLIVNLGVVGVIYFGGLQTTYGNIQVGQVIAFVNYLLRSLFSLVMVSMLMMRVSRAEASAERILEVLRSEPEVRNRPGAISAFAPQGRVAFDNVTFGYNGRASVPVLRDVNFVAEPGQTVAILGATGSGKSSLVHLIPRFYDVNEGRVTIDGLDVRDVEEEALRRRIGIALQESVLFSGTVRDNIRYGRPEAMDEEIIAAAKAAQAHEFISAFPDGYDTLVGQRGVNLSGGQKQRIAIARALIINPTILILDDSMSAVDLQTEARIQAELEALLKERTSFVITQRISTALNADKILVLDDGRIAADGTHRELLASSPLYREIYASQSGNGVTANA